jgi:hypothetical protein
MAIVNLQELFHGTTLQEYRQAIRNQEAVDRHGFRYQPTILQHYRETVSKSAELVEYLRDVPIQAVLTISGYGRYDMVKLKGIEHDLVSAYQRSHKAPLSYAVSYEQAQKYANIHMVIACSYPLDISFIEAILRLRKVDFKIETVDESRKDKLLSYVFKELNFNIDYEWDIKNLDFYLQKTPGNSRSRRRLKRHRERLQDGPTT